MPPPGHVLMPFGAMTALCAMAFAILAGAVIAATTDERTGGAALWVIGLAAAFAVAAMTPYSMPNLHRTSTFFLVSSALFPFLLAWAARADAGRWSATVAAVSYTALICLLIWILPRFTVQPEIGPIYEPVALHRVRSCSSTSFTSGAARTSTRSTVGTHDP